MERRSFSRLISVILLAVAELSVSSEVLAQTSAADKRAKAEALNKQAALEMIEENYASACAKFAEVVELVPSGIGAKMSLAACYERWGRLASALGAYRLAEQAAGDAKDAREKEAHNHAAELEAKTAKLTLIVPEEVAALPGLEIACDGEGIGSEWWNNPKPIDKGPHVLLAFISGKQIWRRELDLVADGIRAWITVARQRSVEPVKPAPVKPALPPEPL